MMRIVGVERRPGVDDRPERVRRGGLEAGEVGGLVELVAEGLRDAHRHEPVVAEPERHVPRVGLVDPPRNGVARRRPEVVVGDLERGRLATEELCVEREAVGGERRELGVGDQLAREDGAVARDDDVLGAARHCDGVAVEERPPDDVALVTIGRDVA